MMRLALPCPSRMYSKERRSSLLFVLLKLMSSLQGLKKLKDMLNGKASECRPRTGQVYFPGPSTYSACPFKDFLIAFKAESLCLHTSTVSTQKSSQRKIYAPSMASKNLILDSREHLSFKGKVQSMNTEMKTCQVAENAALPDSWAESL